MNNRVRNALACVCMMMIHYTVHGMNWGAIQKISTKKVKVYAVAGLGGGGSDTEYVRNLFKGHDLDIERIVTSLEDSDLGQDRCIRKLREELEKDNGSHDIIIHASSQGAATILNYMAEESNQERIRRIKCLILEGLYMSGNRGITHTLRGSKGEFGPIMHAPFSESWVPYLARLIRFHGYCPSKQQPIKSIAAVPHDVVVIMAHGQEDPKVPHDDACAGYHALRQQGNDKTFLISKPGSNHTHVLESSDGVVIQEILKTHNILPGNADKTIDLAQYQPDHKNENYRQIYHAIFAQESMHEQIATPIYVTAALFAGYVALRSALYVRKKLYRNV